MESQTSTPQQTLYVIEHDSYAGSGPYTGEQIDAMVKSGEIAKNQKVKKVHSGKIITADCALLSARANDQPPSPPSKGKFAGGIALIITGIAIIAFLLFAEGEGERARGKLFVIPALLILGGAKMAAYNSRALKAEQGGGPDA